MQDFKTPRRKALVIGGSLGGLFAANWLTAVGWDVAVFERVEDDLASRGAGIGTHEELLETCETYRQIVESQLAAGARA